MKDFIKKQLVDFDENAFIHALKLFIVVALLVILYGLVSLQFHDVHLDVFIIFHRIDFFWGIGEMEGLVCSFCT